MFSVVVSFPFLNVALKHFSSNARRFHSSMGNPLDGKGLISSHGEQNQMSYCNLSRMSPSFSFSFLRPQ